MPTNLPSDPLFQAMRQAARAPLEPGEVALRALLQQAQDGQLPWHLAFGQAALSHRLAGADSDEALRLAEAALAGFEAQDCDWGRSAALSAQAAVRTRLGEVHRALDLHLASVNLARRTGDDDRIVGCLSNTSFALGLLGQHETALVLAEEAHDMRDRLPPRMRTVVCGNFAWALVELGRRERSAEAPAAQWRQRAQRAVDVLGMQLQDELPSAQRPSDQALWSNLAAALVLLDQHERARRIFACLLPGYSAAGDGHAQLFLHRHLGWSHLQCGQWEDALACAQAHHALVRALGRAADEHRGLEIEALALEQAGRWREALAVFRQFHALHARHVLEQAEEKARSMAVAMQTDRALRESQLDALTDLANRRAFDAALARAVGQPTGEVHALMLIDMDHFKQVNDRHGHAAGDEALRALAAAMKRSCRSSDLPARLGGDEFAVLVAADTATALQLAQRLRGELRQWRPAAAGMASPTLSIGVAALAPGMAAADWLAAADAALYAAKAAGRDAVRAAPARAAKPQGATDPPDPTQPPLPHPPDGAAAHRPGLARAARDSPQGRAAPAQA